MGKLRSRMLLPPRGFYFVQGVTVLNGGSFDDTVDLIRRHRAANKLEPGDPVQELEDFTCDRAPNYCYEKTLNFTTPSLLRMAFSATKAYAAWTKLGFAVVDQVEANRRADICLNCPQNSKEQPKKGCCGKNKFNQAVSEALSWPVIRNKVTPADNGLGTCKLCGCPNRVTVWGPMEIFSYSEAEINAFKAANPKCWKGE